MIRIAALSSLATGRSAQSFLLERTLGHHCHTMEFTNNWSSLTMQQSTAKRLRALSSTTTNQHWLSLQNTTGSSTSSTLSTDDLQFLSQALDYARLGAGHTFPNPAVGCVLVEQESQRVLGSGFHPRAGYPHAEIFALLQATGHVNDGVAAARFVENDTITSRDNSLQALVQKCGEEDGPRALFGNAFARQAVTAYVTLEPCCHYGKTPPCASSLALAKVDRVVVGFRDPNPRVDGGGIKALQDAGIQVDLANIDETIIGEDCSNLVKNFVKRIIPKDYDAVTYSHITGAMRRILRRNAARRKNEDTLIQVSWSGKVEASDEQSVEELELLAEWMERVDGLLWEEKCVLTRPSPRRN
jgi:pyrimidine deaminase RibD-like protein